MELNLNLASRPYLNRQSVRLWLLCAAAILVLLFLFNVLYAFQNYRQLGLLDARFEELKAQTPGDMSTPAGYSSDRFEEIMDEVSLGNEIVAADQFRWTALLDRFEELLPADVKINSIQPNFSQKSVQLSCFSKDVTAMTEFMDNLLASEDMNKAFLKSHGEVESQQNGLRQTQVSFALVIEEAF